MQCADNQCDMICAILRTFVKGAKWGVLRGWFWLFAVCWWLLAIGRWLFAVGCLLLAVCYWLFAVGYLLLAVCYWLVVLSCWNLRLSESRAKLAWAMPSVSKLNKVNFCFSICPRRRMSDGSRWDPETSSGWHNDSHFSRQKNKRTYFLLWPLAFCFWLLVVCLLWSLQEKKFVFS